MGFRDGPRKDRDVISRRKVLRTMGVGGVASVTTLGTMSTQAVADATKVNELSGEKRLRILSNIQKKDQFRQIEKAIRNNYNVRKNRDSASVYEITESNDEERHVVSIPYIMRNGESGSEIFIQYTGIDEISGELFDKSEFPNFAGYHVEKTELNINSEGGLNIAWDGIEEYVVKDGVIKTRNIEEDEVGTEGNYMPCCGGGGGSCDTCHIEVATGCAPSLSCILDIAAAFLTSVSLCGTCYLDPEPITKSLLCAGCVGAVIGHRDAPSCLGCDDTELQCVPTDLEDTVC